MKRIVTLILCLVFIVLSVSFNISAIDDKAMPDIKEFTLSTNVDPNSYEENIEGRASGLILSTSLSLSKTGTTLQISGLTNCSLDVVKCGFKNLTIQRRKSSSDSWEDYYEFGNVYIDATIANLSTTLVVASGYQYRISCKHYAKKNLLFVQTISNTSNIVTVS